MFNLRRYFSPGAFAKYRAAGRRMLYERPIAERKQAEEALRGSEEQYRTLVAGSIQGVLIHRDDKPLFANQALADIFGYDNPEEILAISSVGELKAEHEKERLKQYSLVRLNKENAPVRYEFEGIRKGGTSIWLENFVTVVIWNGEPAVQSTTVSITKRRRAEEALREREEQYRTLLVGSIQGVLIHRNDRPLFANQALADTFGYDSPEEILALSSIKELKAKHEQERLKQYSLARLRDESAPVRYEFEGLRKDGTSIWCENFVSVIIWNGEPAVQSTTHHAITKIQL